ncbi:MAG: neutral zinc metallopeptidase [Actinomycetota bacterium]|nr:neutral zinc metallopeptidase [Actinomycetota bacterium]
MRFDDSSVDISGVDDRRGFGGGGALAGGGGGVGIVGLSVGMELQADRYAGVWGRLADERGNVSITRAELGQALNAAAAVGDDRIQERTQGRVDPESWMHGSASQRRSWFARGFGAGSVDACDTFSAL